MKKLFMTAIMLFFAIFTFSQTTTTWTGNVDSYWEEVGNWTNGIPDATTDAIISYNPDRVCKLAVWDTEDPWVCNNLTIDPDAQIEIGNDIPIIMGLLEIHGDLTINSDSGVLVYDFLTVFGDTYVNGCDGMILKSAIKNGWWGQPNTVYTASFINHGDIFYSGGCEVRSEVLILNDGIPGNYFHHQVGPMVKDSEFEIEYGQTGLILNKFNIEHFGTYAYQFEEATDTWTNIWYYMVPVPTTTGMMLSTIDATDYTLSQVGEFFSGDITIDPSHGIDYEQWDDMTYTTKTWINVGKYTKDGNGYNLISNPYSAKSNWDVLYNGNNTNVGSTIYIWNPSNGNYETYVANGSGTMSKAISIGQAFFVETINPTFTFYENSKIHELAPFIKDQELYSLNIKLAGNSYVDGCAINFNSNSTVDYDELYDAYKWGSMFTDATEIKTDNDLTVNSLPFGVDSVNLYLKCDESTEYVILVKGADSFENYNVILEDKLTNEFINLREIDSIPFNTTAISFENRFTIHFDISTNIPTHYENENINIYSYDKYINISGEFDNVVVTNTLGQKIYEGNKNKISIDKSGIYIVSVYDNNSKTTNKVYIK